MLRVLRNSLLLLFLAPLSWAQGPEDEAGNQLLESRAAKDLAWAAHRAAENRDRAVAEKIAALAQSPPPTDESGIERAQVFRAFADALFVNRVACDSKTLEKLEAEHTPSRMLIALASLEPSAAEDWLIEQLNRNIEYEVYEVVVGLLAVARSEPFFVWLTAEVEPTIRVVMEGPSLGLGGYSSGRYRADKTIETKAPEGYPPLVDYGLSKRARENTIELGISGPGATLVVRSRLGLTTKLNKKVEASLGRDFMLRDLFYLVAEAPLSEELLGEGLLRFPEDSTSKAVNDRVQVAREAWATHYWNALDKLLELKLLKAAHVRRLRPKFAVKIVDNRPKGAVKLWRMEKAIKKPDWVKDLR